MLNQEEKEEKREIKKHGPIRPPSSWRVDRRVVRSVRYLRDNGGSVSGIYAADESAARLGSEAV